MLAQPRTAVGQRTVLLVEDEPMVREVVAEALVCMACASLRLLTDARRWSAFVPTGRISCSLT